MVGVGWVGGSVKHVAHHVAYVQTVHAQNVVLLQGHRGEAGCQGLGIRVLGFSGFLLQVLGFGFWDLGSGS